MKKCLVCNKNYKPPRETSKYCSRSCQITGKNKASKKADVTLICEVCGKKFVVPYTLRKMRKTCSSRGKGCASILANSKKDKESIAKKISNANSGNAYWLGKTHSKKSKEKIRKKTIERLSDPTNNGMYGRKHSSESRNKMSETRTRKIVNGEYDKSKWSKRGEIFSKKADRLISYRSMWEKRAIEMLEEDENVESFQFECFRIPYYRQEGKRKHKRHYVPDFLVKYRDGSKKLVEVKPKCYINSAENILKFAAAREKCKEKYWKFEIWTQDKLFGESG